MARELRKVIAPAPAQDVADWIETVAGASIAKRAERIAAIESGSSSSIMEGTPPGLGMTGTIDRPLEKKSWRWIVPAAIAAAAVIGGVTIAIGRSHPASADSRPAPSAPPIATPSIAVTTTSSAPPIAIDDLPQVAVVADAGAEPIATAIKPKPRGKVNLDHVIDSRK